MFTKSIARIAVVLIIGVFLLGNATHPVQAKNIIQGGGAPSIASSVRAAGTTIYRVKTTGAASGACGNTWAAACTLQRALSLAVSSDEIWVAAGKYKPTNSKTDRAATFSMKNGVALYGGFAGTETQRSQRNWTSHVTILSGDIDNNDSQSPIITNVKTVTGNTTNSRHVVTNNTNATLDGFTITAGYGGLGAGIYSVSGKLILRNIVISGNVAQTSGGGMRVDGGSSSLTKVTFKNNSAYYGGGLDNWGTITLVSCVFQNNQATGGGGIYSHMNSRLTLSKVFFYSNVAAVSNTGQIGEGGGLSLDPGEIVTLRDVTFNDNTASLGGGIYNYDATASLKNVTFYNNKATYTGGGMYNDFLEQVLTLTNVTFSNNTAGEDGGGIYNTQAQLIVNNATFSKNTAGKTGGGIASDGYTSLTVKNSIFWGNTSPNGPQIYNAAGSYYPILANSVIQGGCPSVSSCQNVISTNPLLGSLGHYGGSTQTIPLLAGSSAIDKGNDSTCAATDQRGIARPQGAHCDIGAYEYKP